ncbi:helix-turn-helix transcriptional regulator [Streptacidiphilus monticola]
MSNSHEPPPTWSRSWRCGQLRAAKRGAGSDEGTRREDQGVHRRAPRRTEPLPQDIAAAHSISLRYLHQLFQRQGTTVNSYVRTRRLEAARSELARTQGPRRTVAAVAARWGFTSAAHFSRVFRQSFGMTPLQWRNAGRDQHAPERASARAAHPPCAARQVFRPRAS